nr:ABC transporter permease subunit [Candidatus Njordarchaeum guaymaensis]
MFGRAMILARKELREVFRSRMIKLNFIIPALLFGVAIPVIFGIIGGFMASAPISGGDMPFPVPPDFFPDITNPTQRFYLILLYTIGSGMLLILPVFLPIYIAADSFAGERERKTIQQLLSTPLTDSEILLGKILTALIPTVITTYACALSTTIVINYSWWSAFHDYRIVFPNLVALIQILLLYPMLAFFSILVMCWISTRVNKVMEATQFGGVVVIPILVVVYGSFFGLPVLTTNFMLLTAGLFALLNYGLFKLASKRFSREALLTKI